MSPFSRRRVAVIAVAVALGCVSLASAVGAGSSSQASWTWSVAVPGDATPRAADATTASTTAAGAREIAATGDFVLLASEQGGTVSVGPVVGGRAQMEPLEQVAADQPLVTYSAAAPEGGQQLVGVARSDVDRVDAILGDGSVQDLQLNQWRGFSYEAANADKAASSLIAYSSGAAVGAVQLPQTTTQATGASGVATPVYGVFRASFAAQTVMIARVNSRTLRPTGRALQLVSQVFGVSALSPDGGQLALASDKPSALVIVNLRTLQVARRLPVAGGSRIRRLSWPEPDRLLELRQTMKGPYQRNVGSRSVVAIDPASGTRVGSSSITNRLSIRGAVSTPQGLVLLLGPSGLHGSKVTLVLAAPDGSAKSVELPVGAQKGVMRWSQLAVDSASEHAYVVVAGGVVFDVELPTMVATRHVLAAPAAARSVAPPIGILQAGVLGHNLVVAGIFGTKTAPVAQGVSLIDTQSWKVHVVDAGASRFGVLGDRLLTYGLTALPPSSRLPPSSGVVGHGLMLYDVNGKRLTHLYGTQRFQNITLTPGYGHVLYNGKTSGTVPQPGKRYPRGRIYYAGPNDQLIFDLNRGEPLGNGSVSHQRPPLGPPLLIYRGSEMVGESGDRVTSSAIPPSPTTTNGTTTTRTTAAPAPRIFALAASTAAAVGSRYTISNRGRQVAPKQGRGRLFEDHPYKLFLLGTRDGAAFYRVQLTPHFTCWGNGDDAKIGRVGSLGCPNLVGAYPLQNEATVIRMNPRNGKQLEYLQLAGLAVDQAKSMALVAGGGKQIATTPVVNNIYAFPRPYPKQRVRVVALDANGNELKPHPEWGQHQMPPKNLFGPRATRVQPSKLGHIVQQASAQGVTVSVDDKSVVRFEGSSTRNFRPPAGRHVYFNCLQITGNNVRKTRSAGITHEWVAPVAFKVLGYIKPPFDGCEIQGTYGHRWHDAYGPHSAVEIPLTERGRRYFEDRAAARDLALFVRSQKTQQIRKLTSKALVAAIRRTYGSAVVVLDTEQARARAGTVGVWTSESRTVFSEISSVGVRFFVEIENGKVKRENVRELAFVF
jgi:hypothetical protein